MGYPIQQSQTAQPLEFLMVDATDHLTGKTGLSPTVTLSKNGGSFASPAGAVTEVGVGWYKVAGNATDANTLGPLVLHATGAGADPTDDRFDVVAYNPQDAVRFGLTALPNVAAGSAGGLSSDLAALQADTDNLQTRIPAALVSGRMDTSVGAIAANAITAASMAADASSEIADQVWDEVMSGHLTGGSTGASLNGAGSAGDPWVTALPGAYGAGTAGKLVGDNINETISSRASQTSVDTVDNLLDTEVAAIQADTDNIQTRLPAALVGGRMDSNASAIAGDATAATNLRQSALSIYVGSVTGAASTTTLVDSGLTQANDHWIGRILLFTTGTLAKQATSITDFVAATDTLTFVALTGTPGGGDQYVIV